MDLCGEMLAREIELRPHGLTCERLIPPFHRRLGRLTPLPFPGARFNADRLLNRYLDYPQLFYASGCKRSILSTSSIRATLISFILFPRSAPASFATIWMCFAVSCSPGSSPGRAGFAP